MANDGTIEAIGLVPEYITAGRGGFEAIGLTVEYTTTGFGSHRAIGLTVEYSEDERNAKMEAVGLIVEYREFAIYSVDVATVGDRGGTKLTLNGTFKIDETYTISAEGEGWYSGVIGNAYTITCTTAGELEAMTPPLPPGGPYDIDVVEVSTSSQATLSSALTVDKSAFPSNVYSMRSMVGPPRKVGPRSISDEEV